jgi:capsular exopolysaccharide synthesis family protein
LYDELKLLNEQKSAVVFAVNYYNYLDSYLRKKNDYAQIILPSSIGIADEILNTLVTQLVTLQTELNLLPGSKELQNPMINERAGKLGKAVSETRSQIVEAINTLRTTDKIKITGIDQQTTRLTDRLGKLPGIQRRLVNIQRNYTFNENMYTFLQEKKAEAGISQASTTSDIIVVNPPRIAGGAITPQVSQNYFIGIAAGLLIPFLAFILLELVNTKIQSKEDIEKISSIPFIGGIGHNANGNNLVVYKKPKSAMAESFRALRSNLNYFTEGKDRKILMVTSSLSGEGKSFTTINLATVFSLAGKKTIIVGADLRKPKIFEDFDLGNERGLSTYLSGMSSLDEVIQHTSVEYLDMISGGPVPPNPSELLMGERMEKLMNELKTRYDYVLMDTPPLSLITDGLVLSKFADHTIFIVRQNYTPRTALSMVEEIYQSGKIDHISLVLNDVYRTGPGYGYTGYSYGYYDYGYYGKKSGSGGYYQDEA